MSEFKVNTITNRDGSYGPQICGITTFGSSGMQLPSGPTEMRGGRGRGIVGGGYPGPQNTMDLVEISPSFEGRRMTFIHAERLICNFIGATVKAGYYTQFLST